jgi:hypothetical protein
VSEFLAHVGPDASLESIDSLASIIDLSFRGGKIELPTGSLQALLASGELSTVANSELKALLATWPAEVSRLRNQSGLLEDNRKADVTLKSSERAASDPKQTLRIYVLRLTAMTSIFAVIVNY